MLYNCNICGKQFKQKCHYTNHLNRINPCIKLTKKIPQNPPISSKIPQHPPILHQTNNEYIIKKRKKNYSSNIFYLLLKFSQNIYRFFNRIYRI